MGDKNAEKDEEKLVMVGDGLDDEHDEDAEEGKKVVKAKAKEADAKDGDADEDDEEEGEELEASGDTRVRHGEDSDSDDDREAKRRERKLRKQRAKEARNRDQAELRFLRTRNEDLERRFSHLERRTATTEIVAIDQRINHIKSQIKIAEDVHAAAVEKSDGKSATEALRIKSELEQALGRLSGARERVVAEATETQRQQRSTTTNDGAQGQQRAQVDPQLISHAQRFLGKHDWIDPMRGDEDSAIVGAIDDALMASDEWRDRANTKAYWDELERRIKARLPHRFKTKGGRADDDEDDEDDEDEDATPRQRVNGSAERRASGPRFAVGGRERPLKKNEVYISPERKAAMIEAGAWEDPILRQRMLKRYQKYDQENSRNN